MSATRPGFVSQVVLVLLIVADWSVVPTRSVVNHAAFVDRLHLVTVLASVPVITQAAEASVA